MNKKITSALISVYYKDGLDDLIRELHAQEVILYSTGGTQQFIESLGVPCVAVESITSYPSILGGRVKTLHPKIFGGILGRHHVEQDQVDMREYAIPTIDLVIVDLYPFEETVAATTDEAQIIEKIDIGGPSMIRAAAKNFTDITVLASKSDYGNLLQILRTQQGQVNLEQRRQFAAKAFEVVMHYDIAISNYFNTETNILRYGENPHQKARFTGKQSELFTQLHGKELSYNNLVDVDAAMQLLAEFTNEPQSLFAIIKHTNVCGVAIRPELVDAWQTALACDSESAFGGILICNRVMDQDTATAISDIFFEVLIAPGFSPEALLILQQKKNRILLHQHHPIKLLPSQRSVLQGMIMQDADQGNTATWLEEGGRACTDAEKEDLLIANLICKHLKSNAIAIVKNKQLLGKGCGQTSRIDALKQSIDKAAQFGFDLSGAVLASDAFFPFDDCVRMAHTAGITALIQPGGSIRDKDSIAYCKDNSMAMVITGMRHFRH